jgi:hypothetical protein
LRGKSFDLAIAINSFFLSLGGERVKIRGKKDGGRGNFHFG